MHFVDQRLCGERFLKKCGPGFEHAVMADDLIRVPGNIEHFDFGPQGDDDLGKTSSAHFRHDNVGYKRMNPTRMRFGGLDRYVARSRIEHEIATVTEDSGYEGADGVFVLHEQD